MERREKPWLDVIFCHEAKDVCGFPGFQRRGNQIPNEVLPVNTVRKRSGFGSFFATQVGPEIVNDGVG